MTRELAMVHAREGIRLNSLCPGPLQTPLLMDFLDTPEKKERRMVHIPMGRFGEAIEQAKGALFLASDDSSFITGTGESGQASGARLRADVSFSSRRLQGRWRNQLLLRCASRLLFLDPFARS